MDYKNFLLVIFSTWRMSFIDGVRDEGTNYAFSLRKVRKITEETYFHDRFLRTSSICRSDEEELERICKLAIRCRKLKKYPIAYNNAVAVGEAKFYRLHISNFVDDEIVQACQCRSIPPIYLTDGMPKREKTHRPVIKVTKRERKKLDEGSVAVTLLVDKAVTVDGTFRRIIRRCRNKPIRLNRKEHLKMEQAIVANCI